jgi:hypothetical protein
MSLPDPAHSRNDASHTGAYATSVYALEATGGFTMERGFDDIKFRAASAPVHIDVTDSIQLTMDVATFNTKAGAFDAVSDTVANDEISISAAELIAGVTSASQIISVGKYATLYSDFQAYVAAYFGFDGGFSSLFAAASEFHIDGDDTFTGASFIRLLNGETEAAEGNYISNLTGSITISNINQLLRYAIDANVFGNRDPATKNWGMSDKFVAGDLIWVPAGTTVTLKLAIDAESFAPLNNIGVSNTASITQSTNVSTGLFQSNTTATTTLISRTVTAPLLIKLA